MRKCDAKVARMVKPQILLLETVVELSSPNDEPTLYGYSISNRNYVIFAFTPKNEMLLIDYVTISVSVKTSGDLR